MKKFINILCSLLLITGLIIKGPDVFFTNEWVFYVGRIALLLGIGFPFIALFMIFIVKRFEPDISDEKLYTMEFKFLLAIAAILAIVGAILELKPH